MTDIGYISTMMTNIYYRYLFHNVWVLLLLFGAIWQYKLIFYLMRKKPKRWKKLIKNGKFFYIAIYYPNLKGHIGFASRWFKYVFSDLDTKDETIKKYKKWCKLSIVLVLIYIVVNSILLW